MKEPIKADRCSLDQDNDAKTFLFLFLSFTPSSSASTFRQFFSPPSLLGFRSLSCRASPIRFDKLTVLQCYFMPSASDVL